MNCFLQNGRIKPAGKIPRRFFICVQFLSVCKTRLLILPACSPFLPLDFTHCPAEQILPQGFCLAEKNCNCSLLPQPGRIYHPASGKIL